MRVQVKSCASSSSCKPFEAEAQQPVIAVLQALSKHVSAVVAD
jgi:hypothetical protein